MVLEEEVEVGGLEVEVVGMSEEMWLCMLVCTEGWCRRMVVVVGRWASETGLVGGEQLVEVVGIRGGGGRSLDAVVACGGAWETDFRSSCRKTYEQVALQVAMRQLVHRLQQVEPV